MTWLLLGLGLMLIVEGLAYALAPSLVERMLEVLRELTLETRRLIGLLAITAGNERVHSEGKWGSVDKALNEIEKLLDEKNNKEDQSILLATKEQLLSMQQ